MLEFAFNSLTPQPAAGINTSADEAQQKLQNAFVSQALDKAGKSYRCVVDMIFKLVLSETKADNYEGFI